MSGNILTIIETDLKDGIQFVETEAKIVWGVVTGVAAADAKAFVGDVSTLWSKLLPAEYALFKTFAAKVLGDAFSGDFAAAETDLLNLAEQAEATFVADMGSPLIQALLAMLKATGL